MAPVPQGTTAPVVHPHQHRRIRLLALFVPLGHTVQLEPSPRPFVLWERLATLQPCLKWNSVLRAQEVGIVPLLDCYNPTRLVLPDSIVLLPPSCRLCVVHLVGNVPMDLLSRSIVLQASSKMRKVRVHANSAPLVIIATCKISVPMHLTWHLLPSKTRSS